MLTSLCSYKSQVKDKVSIIDEDIAATLLLGSSLYLYYKDTATTLQVLDYRQSCIV